MDGAKRICANPDCVAGRTELERFREGRLTVDEVNNLCHNLDPALTPEQYCNGCEDYQNRLFGRSPITELRKKLSLLTALRERTQGVDRDQLAEVLCRLSAHVISGGKPDPDEGLPFLAACDSIVKLWQEAADALLARYDVRPKAEVASTGLGV